MSNLSLADPFGFSRLSKSAIGFDEMFKKISDITTQLPSIPVYPPYNVKKVNDTHYIIELAVAGFGKHDIDIIMENGTLTVKGNMKSDDTGYETLYKGIAERAFTRQFNLADSIEVKNAEMFNGLLKIYLEKLIPEHQKPKKIEISEVDDEDDKNKKKK